MTLRRLLKHFFLLYGRRNRIFFHGLHDRIHFLNVAIGDLQDVVRKERANQSLEVALARVVARIFCVAEHFLKLPFVEAMSLQYPSTGCGYCRDFPCSCVERRPEPKLDHRSSAPNEQLDWSIGEWCAHLEALYGEKNRAKGIENTLNRLFREISELMSLSMQATSGEIDGSLDEIEWEFASELSQALAWTIAIANLFQDVDLESAILERYGSGCSHCHANPCECVAFRLAPMKWE